MTAELTRVEDSTAINAIANLPRDLAILRIDNDNIMSAAAAHPRNPVVILAELKAQLKACPQFAQEAIYARDVGKDRETGQRKIARGLSIHAAQAMAEAYGYCRVDWDAHPLDADHAMVGATFVDYQKGRVMRISKAVARYYTSYAKQRVRYDDDRFWNVVIPGAASRMIRECIVRSMPTIANELERYIEEDLAKMLDAGGVQQIVQQFAKHGVTVKQLEAYIQRPSREWTEDDRRRCRQVWVALRDGEMQPSDIVEPTPDAVPGAPPKTLDDLVASQIEPVPPKPSMPPAAPRRGRPAAQPPQAAPAPAPPPILETEADVGPKIEAWEPEPIAPTEPMTREEVNAEAARLLPIPDDESPIGPKSELYAQMKRIYNTLSSRMKTEAHDHIGSKLSTDWADYPESRAREALAILEKMAPQHDPNQTA